MTKTTEFDYIFTAAAEAAGIREGESFDLNTTVGRENFSRRIIGAMNAVRQGDHLTNMRAFLAYSEEGKQEMTVGLMYRRDFDDMEGKTPVRRKRGDVVCSRLLKFRDPPKQADAPDPEKDIEPEG